MCNWIVRIRIDEEHRSNAAFRLTKIESGDGAKAVWLAADPGIWADSRFATDRKVTGLLKLDDNYYTQMCLLRIRWRVQSYKVHSKRSKISK